MASEKVYQITLHCSYKEWWRYNVQMQCGSYNEAGEQVGFTAESRIVAEVGANLKEPPTTYKATPKLALKSIPCHRARFLIYILPHTLPAESRLEEVTPFNLKIAIACNGQELHTEQYAVNPWSGASIELMLE